MAGVRKRSEGECERKKIPFPFPFERLPRAGQTSPADFSFLLFSFARIASLRVCFYFTVKDWAQLTCIQHGGHDHHEQDGADELFVGNVRTLMNEVWVFKQSDHT